MPERRYVVQWVNPFTRTVDDAMWCITYADARAAIARQGDRYSYCLWQIVYI